MIQIENINVSYKETLALDNITLNLEGPSITGIIGPNGAGKSTLIKALIGIIPHSGKILFNKQPIRQQLNRISYVAQKADIDFNFPITVKECISLGLYPKTKFFKRLSKSDWSKVTDALTLLGLTDLSHRQISQLSGGQFQRVLIARCLVQEADIILLDEPTTYLDLNHQLEILELLKELNQKNKTTIVMVLHDLNLASKYSDYLLAMKDGEIVKYGTPKEVFNKEMLENCFQINGEIFIDKKSDKPLCVSYELLRKKGDNDEK